MRPVRILAGPAASLDPRVDETPSRTLPLPDLAWMMSTSIRLQPLLAALLAVLVGAAGVPSPAAAQSLSVTSIRPESGAPGTTVRIYGTGFSTTASENTVTIGAATAAVDSASASVIYAQVPSGAAGGPADVAVSSGSETVVAADRFSVLTGGTASFTTATRLPGVSSSSAGWGDYDGDGDLDLVLTGIDANFNLTAAIYENTADGTFTAIGAGLEGVGGLSDSDWGDFDADGDLDLVITGQGTSGRVATIYENAGEDTFTPLGAGLTGVDFGSVDWGNVDRDTDLDLVITGDDGTAKTARIYENQGSGVFAPIQAGLTGVRNSSSDWGDFDGDGDLDLIVTGNNTATIYENQGGGSFAALQAGLTGVRNGSSAEWADVDGDGDLDVVVAGRSENSTDAPITTLYENEGGGTFTPLQAGLVDVDEASLDWGDVNADGRPDLLLTGYDTDDIPVTAVYLNQGGGTFEPAGTSLPGVRQGSAKWGDYDGDGQLDVVLTGLDVNGDPVATVFENTIQTFLFASREQITYGRAGVADSLTRTVTLTNDGTSSVSVDVAVQSGTHFAVEGDRTRTIDAGASTDVGVAFVPDAGGIQRDTLRVRLAGSSSLVVPPIPLEGEGVSVSVNDPSVSVSVDESATVTVRVPQNLSPTSGTLFYRPTGAPSYQSQAFNPGDVGTETSIDIPASVATERGIDYYVELVESRVELSDLRVTFPAETPRIRPARIRTSVPEATAAGPFPERAYRMISVPLDAGDRSPEAVFTNQYGDYRPDRWRLVRYDPSADRYRDLPQIDGPLRPGVAYWLVTAEGDSLTVEDARSVSATEAQPVVVQPGWNQVAAPFAFPVAWSSVVKPESVGDPVAYRPEDGSYRYGASILQPWRGYFVYNRAREPDTLFVPPVEAEAAPAAASAQEGGGDPAGAKGETPGAYRMQIQASYDTGDRVLRDRQNWIGFQPEARAGFGEEDAPEAPPVGDYVQVSVVPDEGPALARSTKPAGRDGQSWDVRVSASVDEPFATAKTVRLRFTETGTRPPGYRLYVFDRDRSTRLDVEDGTAEVRLSPDTPTRRLRIVVGTRSLAKEVAGDVPLRERTTRLWAPSPNPVSASASTTITYEVAEPAPVTLALYDVLGRRVRTFVDRRREPGRYDVEWQAGDGPGSGVASGVYFVRLQAGSVTQTRKLVVVQ